VDAGVLEYAVTMDDRTTWEKPWTVKVEMGRQDAKANAIYDEPRCHDGNIALKDMLIGARMDDKAFAERLDAQRNWPAVTDCDRLDQAFADLDRSGIVARQNFTCCQNCGHAEIGDEIAAAEESGIRPIGYTFFHWQTTDRVVEDGNLYLYYGAVAGDGAASVRVGRAIVETLERHCLAVEWNGTLDKAIHVRLKWQRRVSQQMAERDSRMR
jgi:hypothetical protein